MIEIEFRVVDRLGTVKQRSSCDGDPTMIGRNAAVRGKGRNIHRKLQFDN